MIFHLQGVEIPEDEIDVLPFLFDVPPYLYSLLNHPSDIGCKIVFFFEYFVCLLVFLKITPYFCTTQVSSKRVGGRYYIKGRF